MDEPTPVVVYGSGGHAAVIVDIIECLPSLRVGGVCDHEADRLGVHFLGYTVGAPDDYPLEWPFVVGLGDNQERAQRVAELAARGRGFVAALVHPRACVSRHATLGEGTVVMAGAVINPRSTLGSHVIVNTRASIDHDCVLGDYAHISPGANVAGRVSVGAFTQVGIGASVIQVIRIGSRVVIGAGAVVIRDVPDDVVMVGNPARLLRGP